MNPSFSPLPDLFPYHVPEGTSVPAETRTCRRLMSGSAAIVGVSQYPVVSDGNVWVEESTRQLLPRHKHAALIDVALTSGATGRAYRAPMCEGDYSPWLFVPDETRDSAEWVGNEEIASFTVAQVAPAPTVVAPDPMDENDHRRRIVVWKASGKVGTLTREHDRRWTNSATNNTGSLKDWRRRNWHIAFEDEQEVA